MEELIINKTSNTPKVHFDPELGLLKIEGRSIPENPSDFFENLIYFKMMSRRLSHHLKISR